MTADGPGLRVLYNGSCPVCAREIGIYREAAARSGADCGFVDVSRPDFAGDGLVGDPEQLYRRLHAVDEQGRLLAGLDAFIAVWERLPGWHRLATAARLPLLRPMAAAIYERVLAPWLYRRYRRRVVLNGRRPLAPPPPRL